MASFFLLESLLVLAEKFGGNALFVVMNGALLSIVEKTGVVALYAKENLKLLVFEKSALRERDLWLVLIRNCAKNGITKRIMEKNRMIFLMEVIRKYGGYVHMATNGRHLLTPVFEEQTVRPVMRGCECLCPRKQ